MIVKGRAEELGRMTAFLVESMERVAWPAWRQREWLAANDLGDCADEIALELDDAMHLAPELAEEGFISDAALRASEAVDDVLERISGVDGKWDGAALEHDGDWAEARELATLAFRLLTGGTHDTR